MCLQMLCLPMSVRGACTFNLSGWVGFRNFQVLLDPGDEVCINISYFTYFLAFETFPRDLELTEYRSDENSSSLLLRESVQVRGLSAPYCVISSPFASQTLSTPSGGNVSFAFGSLPGMCQTGVFFSNQITANFDFAWNRAPPHDKCLVFLSQGEQRVLVEMQSEECCDKLFRYEDNL
jgi:hypothetical protein